MGKYTRFLLLVAFFGAVGAPPCGATDVVQSCTVVASKTAGVGDITVAGLLGVSEADFTGITEVSASILGKHMVGPLEMSWPVDAKSFKKGVFSHTKTVGGVQTSLKVDARKTKKFSLSATHANLQGLSCPIEVRIWIGGYEVLFTLDEAIVNGPAKFSPLQFLMGTVDSLLVDKSKISFGTAPNSDSVSVAGAFAMKEAYDPQRPLVITLGDQTFTVPAERVSRTKMSAKCSGVPSEEGPVVTASLDFANAKFSVLLKKVHVLQFGSTDFAMANGGTTLLSAEPVTVPSPKKTRIELDKYRCWNRLGAWWEYDATVWGEGTEGVFDPWGPESSSARIDISGPTVIDGRSCNVFSTSSDNVNMSYAYYIDYWGTHWVEWGTIAGLGDLTAQCDSDLVEPTALELGQAYKTSGPFTGSVDLSGSGLAGSSATLRGTMSLTCKPVGYESVTVPAGDFAQALRLDSRRAMNGKMKLRIDYDYDGKLESLTVGYDVMLKLTEWYAEGVGCVKASMQMRVRVSAMGESVWTDMNGDQELTDYELP